jgi:hypothetical protein
MSRAGKDGKEVLRRNVDTGSDKRLAGEDRQKLPALLKKGPEHYGFRGQVWTRGQVGKVIEEAFDRHGIVDFLRHVLRHIEGENPFSLFQLSLHSCLNIHRKGPTFRFLRVFFSNPVR